MTTGLNLIPINDSMRAQVRSFERICPRTILGFKNNAYDIFAQFRHFEDHQQFPVIDVSQLPTNVRLMVHDDDSAPRDVNVDDKYGAPLTFVLAEQLKGEKFKVGSDPEHIAIKAYLDALPPHTAIVLFWH